MVFIKFLCTTDTWIFLKILFLFLGVILLNPVIMCDNIFA